MTVTGRILGLMGLAAKGRLCVSGEFSVEKAVKSGSAKLVLIAEDASDNTVSKFQSMCEYHHVPCFIFSDRETLGHAIGREMRVSCAVTDADLSKAIIRLIGQEG